MLHFIDGENREMFQCFKSYPLKNHPKLPGVNRLVEYVDHIAGLGLAV